jgi:hypothetical protein
MHRARRRSWVADDVQLSMSHDGTHGGLEWPERGTPSRHSLLAAGDGILTGSSVMVGTVQVQVGEWQGLKPLVAR